MPSDRSPGGSDPGPESDSDSNSGSGPRSEAGPALPVSDAAVAGLRAGIRARVRLVGSAAAVGAALGVVAAGALAASSGDVEAGTRTAFALGALVLGFGVLGWSGSAMVGDSVETAQRYMATGTDWTERDSRRAMARLSGAGAGAMLAVVAVRTVLLG